MCTVGRDQFPRNIKLTSSLPPPLLMFNTAVTAMVQVGLCVFVLVFSKIYKFPPEACVQVGLCVFTGETAQDSFAFKGEEK